MTKMTRMPGEDEMIDGLRARYTDEKGNEWYLDPEQLVYYPIEQLLDDLEELRQEEERKKAEQMEEEEVEEKMMNHYGREWMDWLEAENSQVYETYKRTGQLREKALDISEEAIDMELDMVMKERMRRTKAGRMPMDILEKTKVIRQITEMVREIVRAELVYQMH
jgi:hypothetical protein